MAYIRRMQYFAAKEAERKRNEAESPHPDDAICRSIAAPAPSAASDPVYQAVLDGERDAAVRYAEAAVQRGMAPEKVIDELLIPAINRVGELYNQQVYFLPQLIASAMAMEQAIAVLEPLIERKDQKESATVVIATVEGDVHDIGKNLVGLMLRNYGYRVVDLGKDVPASAIVAAALEEQASIIGLSALMTTTMMRMKEVIAEASGKGYSGKIIIGGAAVTASFSNEIGADGYSKDAADCVKLVSDLLSC